MADVDARQLGSRVRETRKRKGLTQEELAGRVHLDRTVVNKIETGVRRVAALELSDIAQALGVRMNVFFEDPAPAIVSHRSAQGLDTAESQIDGLLADIASEVEFVQTLTPLTARLPHDVWELPRSAQDAEEMAARARQALGLDQTSPITDLARRVADLGLFVFARDLGVDTADAGTVLLRDGGASLVNSANKVGRRRLATAHELAHYLVADENTIDWRVTDDGSQTEARFDQFARALLLPADALRATWHEIETSADGRAAAVVVASRFQVDMSTLARRLSDLQIPDTAPGGVRSVRTTPADMIEFDLHSGDELAGTVQPRVFQQAVLRLVRDERISRERGLDLLWNLLKDEDLPQPRLRDEHEIWQFVS